MNDLYIRLKKTGRSRIGNMLERLKKHEPMCTRSLLLVFMHEPLFIISMVVLGMV